MMTNKIVSASLALLLGWSGTAFAQNEVDALRYSRLGVSGSARIQGLGGAQTALGADISTIGANPAGLGMFRRSEVSITPSFGINKSSATLDNRRATDERNSLGIPHLGVVVSNRKGDSDDSAWRGASFGVSFTKLNDFNSRITYNGLRGGTDRTIVEYFGELANLNNRTRASLDAEFNSGYTSLEGLAFGTYLINVEDDNGAPFVTVLDRVGEIQQREEIIRRGSQSQIDIGVGTSYRDKVYLGASLGVVTSDFSEERIFTESESSTETEFTDLLLRDEFRTRGAGVNLKLGVIFRPIDALRLGATIQTPTAFTLNDTYQRSLAVGFDDGTTERAAESPGEFSYSLTTPFRATGGAAFFINKYGFISADVEYVNYGNARFSEANNGSGSGNYFSAVNSDIARAHGAGVNYRIGAEGRYEVFRVRAGYALSGNPYNNSSYGDGKASTITFGGGVRLLNYYADVAYVTTGTDSRYSPYVFQDGTGPVADITERRNGLVFTVGYNF